MCQTNKWAKYILPDDFCEELKFLKPFTKLIEKNDLLKFLIYNIITKISN